MNGRLAVNFASRRDICVLNLKIIAIILDVRSNISEALIIMRNIAIAFIFTLALSIIGSADIARPEVKTKPVPKQAKQVDGNMVIKLDATATEARLIVPKTQIKQLRADLELLDQDGDDNTAVAGNTMQRTQTIIGGMFLSLAFVFGGFWFVKRNAKGAAAAGMIALVIGSGATVSLVYANIAPPLTARRITSKIFDPNVLRPHGFISGKIKIETGNTDTFELIVPEEGVQTGPRN
jgi:hypothetical protein